MNRSIRLIVLFCFIFSLTGPSAQGQGLSDALRYSQLLAGGSARVMGTGGAFGAMGGDFGVTSLNVSGLADYKSKELLLTFSYNQAGTEVRDGLSVLGENNDGREFIIENLAFVKHVKPRYSENLIASNFAIGLQQYSNYNQVISFDTATPGSIADRFAELTNDFCPCPFDIDFSQDFPFEEDLSTFSGAIFHDPTVQRYLPDYSFGIQSVPTLNKSQRIDRSGALNELVLAWAGKYKGGLNIGLGVGVPIISFSEEKFYSESDPTGNLPFNQLNFDESLFASGTGINLKLGVGYTLLKRIRLGVGYQTPTIYRINEIFFSSLFYDSDNYVEDPFIVNSPEGRFTYRLRTPSRLTLSGGYLMIFEKLKGFVNVDVQRINYTENRFNFTFNSDAPFDQILEDEANAEINNELRPTYSYNLGSEIAFGRYRVRGGVSLLGRPFFDEAKVFDKVYSAGVGYRMNKIFFDLAYQFRQLSEGYSPYSLGGNAALPVVIDTNVNKLALTIGFKL
jgi:hypothetical protein